MSTLGKTMQALQNIAGAVTRDDRDAYVKAVNDAREIGCTPEQIHDAYTYRVTQGATPSFNRAGLSFDMPRGAQSVLQVRRDGEVLVTFADDGPEPAENQAFIWILKHQGRSVYYAIRHGGYSVVTVFGDGSEKVMPWQGSDRKP